MAIALIFHPFERMLSRRLGDRPNINALITLSCIIIVVIPVLGLGAALISEVGLHQKIQAGDIRPGEYIDQVNQSFPAIQSFLAQFDVNFGSCAIKPSTRSWQPVPGQAGTGYRPEYRFPGAGLMVYSLFS